MLVPSVIPAAPSASPAAMRQLSHQPRRVEQVCRTEDTFAHHLHRSNTAADRYQDTAAFSSDPIPLGLALREHNSEDRRAEADANTYPVYAHPARSSHTPPADGSSVASPINADPEHRSASPIVPPPSAAPVFPLVSPTYQRVNPIARGTVIDLLA